MKLVSRTIRRVRPSLDSHPNLLRLLKRIDDSVVQLRHAVAARLPVLIRATPQVLTISVTGRCNFRCIGCRYERDFMIGEQLGIEEVRDVLVDAHQAGVRTVRLYGGEPLLHPDLPEMVRFGRELGMDVYVTTNASLLDRRIDALRDAGLRWLTIGFYGAGEVFEGYTQRAARLSRLEEVLTSIRTRHGKELQMQLNYVVVRPLANRETLDLAWDLVRRFDLFLHFDLYGYSIPFFTSGPENELAFLPEDEPLLDELVDRILEMQAAEPDRFPHTRPFLRSIPDWVLKRADMRIPCDSYRFVWVGPDGSVQLCDSFFPLGNVRQERLRDILFRPAHHQAARDAFQLNCPNCTCQVEDRIRKHGPSWRRYRSSARR